MDPIGRRAPLETRRYFLTVTEVMAIFRVGRITAYALARQYIATGGCSGIPCEKFGGQLRFPTAEIERLIRRPVVFPVLDDGPTTDAGDAASSSPSDASRRLRARHCPPRR